MIDAVGRVILDKPEAVRLLVAALFAGQHALIEDVPGVGKTTLAKALAHAAGCRFSRIQFTPDLLPGDITGTVVHDPQRGFQFVPGPLFGQIVLADEINRASPRTQAALLEAMEERQITVDRITHPLPRPFLVLATKNPLEHEGTFPLPEAQVDRFGLRVTIGYPGARAERALIMGEAGPAVGALPPPVADGEAVVRAQAAVRRVHVHEDVAGYLLSLVQATRRHPSVQIGASPRAALALRDLARAWAAMDGRDYVRPDDVQALAVPVLAHRLVMKPEAAWQGEAGAAVVAELVERLPVPAEPRW
ncbi:MAG: MoxR family ATPase [Firmicutes bacterium]|nr:MoxR family ATPase [Bacillota bacterium]